MYLPITVDSQSPIKALVDTGASVSCVAQSEIKEIEKINKNNRLVITGCGGKSSETLGTIDLGLRIGGKTFNFQFNVFKDSDTRYQMILGLDFISSNGFTIDANKNKITIGEFNKSKINISLTNDHEINYIQYENYPLHAKRNCIVRKNDSERVDISEDLSSLLVDDCYFEGEENDKWTAISGIINKECETGIIVENNGSKVMKIKEGEIIGYINTMAIEEKEEVSEDWGLDKIKETINLDNNKLDNSQKEKIYNMFNQVKTVLSESNNDIGNARVTPHTIEMTNYTPIWQKPRTFAEPLNKEIENQCKDLLENNIIEYSNSRWSSPCVPVRKTDGSLRLCIDYRKVNKVTKTQNYPMPNLKHCLYRANRPKFLTKLDLVRGYYQIKIDDNSKQYTAFSTPNHHYQFKRLAFGLKNSGIAFQRIMQELLQPISPNNIVIYIDDILIASETFDDHLELVRKVLSTLAAYNIKVKVSKCDFFQSSVKFLGHLIDKDGIRKSPEYVQKVINTPLPKTVTELRKFLGLVNFQRDFVAFCSEVVKPLTKLTGQSGKEKLEYTEEEKQAFIDIKELIKKEVTLTYPNYDSPDPLELFVDASSIGAGACLMQKQNDVHRVIGYASMTFSETQQKYSTIERELTAIRWGCQAFKYFLMGIDFVVHTDHKPLVFMNNMSPYNSKIQRILVELADYSFTIKYRPGIDNEAADYLSRLNNDKNKIVSSNTNNRLPKEFKILKKIDGGGDSMFESVFVAVGETLDHIDLPSDHKELRKLAISELINHPEKYNLVKSKSEKRKLTLMLNNGYLPYTEALLAMSKLLGIEIRVYNDITTPVIFKASSLDNLPVIYLQCVSMIHYNPLYTLKNVPIKSSPHLINSLLDHAIKPEEKINLLDYNVSSLFREVTKCNVHQERSNVNVCSYADKTVCFMLDTGAQSSLIDEHTFNRIKTGQEIVEDAGNRYICGFADSRQEIIGVVCLTLSFGSYVAGSFPFAIVKNSHIPSCILLGVNFLKEKEIICQ